MRQYCWEVNLRGSSSLCLVLRRDRFSKVVKWAPNFFRRLRRAAFLGLKKVVSAELGACGAATFTMQQLSQPAAPCLFHDKKKTMHNAPASFLNCNPFLILSRRTHRSSCCERRFVVRDRPCTNGNIFLAYAKLPSFSARPVFAGKEVYCGGGSAGSKGHA